MGKIIDSNRLALTIDDISEGRLPNELLDNPVCSLIGIAHLCPECNTILTHRQYPEHKETEYFCSECWKQFDSDVLLQVYNSQDWIAKVGKEIHTATITVKITYNTMVLNEFFLSKVFLDNKANNEIGIVKVEKIS